MTQTAHALLVYSTTTKSQRLNERNLKPIDIREFYIS